MVIKSSEEAFLLFYNIPHLKTDKIVNVTFRTGF